jgi:hemoglobin-like flavoprotein
MLSGDMRYLELLSRSYSTIEARSHEIGERTYKNMFATSSEIRFLFKNTPPEQAQRLIDTIIFFCEEVDNFTLIYEKLDKIAHIHIQHGVKNEYYPVMKNAFVQALCDTLRIDKSNKLVHAWSYGFDRLAEELIHIENLIRKYSTK